MGLWFYKHHYSDKRYKEICERWNPECVVHIKYATAHSDGIIRVSMFFYMMEHNKFKKLLKDTQIMTIALINESGIEWKVIRYFKDEYELWLYGLEEYTKGDNR